MKRLLLLSAAALLSLPACESPTEGDPDIATVQVMPEDRTLGVGETLSLELTVRDEEGESPSSDDLAAVQWTTSNSAVATVSPQGVVTGVAPGTATISAMLEDVTGSVQVTVAAAPPGCAAAGAVQSLEVGRSVTLNGVTAATVCLSGGAAGAEYVAVPFHAGRLNAGFLTTQLNFQGIIPVLATSPSVSPALALAQGRVPDEEFHQRLRLRAGRELAPYVDEALAARGTGMQPSYVLNLRSPTLGQQVTVNTSTAASCEQPQNRTGRVVAIGTRSIVLADINNPAGGLTDAEYASFAAGFDTLVYPAVTEAFGEPGDVDENNKVVIFYTRAVNELTPQGSGSYVGGFFHPRDLFPTRDRDGLAACAASNVAEMFYMLVPDPSGTINGNAFSRDQVLQTSLGTIGHEFQHLINASRRLYTVGTTNWEEQTWLNEGLSHVAEEVLFYRSAGRAPRQNLGNPEVQSSARVLNAFRTYMDQNLRRFENYLQDPEGQSPYDSTNVEANDLATRGAVWAFLRYAADRRGGTDSDLWRKLVDGSTTGFANLQQALGTDPRPWVRDWTVSVFADEAVPGLEARYQQPSWRFRTFFTTYPLKTRRLTGPGSQVVSIKSGSGAFFRFGVAPATVASITGRNNNGQPLPSTVYLTVLRTK
jgi:Bacterial Ig-like domain (group 2)